MRPVKSSGGAPARQAIRFGVDPQNRLFIKLKDSAIPPVFVLAESITTWRFPGEQQIYLLVDDVLSWHRNEALHASASRAPMHRLVVRALSAAKERHASGAVEWEGKR